MAVWRRLMDEMAVMGMASAEWSARTAGASLRPIAANFLRIQRGVLFLVSRLTSFSMISSIISRSVSLSLESRLLR